MTKTAIVKSDPSVAPQTAAVSEAAAIFSMIERVTTDPSIPIERMEGAFAFYERVRASEARREFERDIAAAKAEIPVILKNRTVDYMSSKGRTHYKYEDLAEIAKMVDPILSKHGISYRFRTKTDAQISVTCILSHSSGHIEENTLSAPRDESGGKNSIQAIGSTVTYLQRYALKAALGLAASEKDDDGNAACAGETISEDQFNKIAAALTEKKITPAKFCAVYKIANVGDLPANRFEEALGRLNKAEVHR